MDKRDLKEDKELRMLELRANEEEEKMILEGYAAVFNEETLIGDESWGWIEVIDPHAFDETDFKDCCLKYNHGDTKGVLARTRNGSLKLTVDKKGLKIRAELQPDVTDHRDVYKCIKSGLLDKMSFAFTVNAEEIDSSSNPIKRTITKIAKLWDCAVVDVPAYDGTSIYARSKELVGEQVRKLQLSAEADKAALENAEKIALRKRKFKFKNNLIKEEK